MTVEVHAVSLNNEELGLRRSPQKIRRPLSARRCPHPPHRSCYVGPTTGATAWSGDGAILSWNAVKASRDGVPVGGTMGVVGCDDGAATNKAPSQGRMRRQAVARRPACHNGVVSAPLWPTTPRWLGRIQRHQGVQQGGGML